MKRISKKRLQTFIDQVAYSKEWDHGYGEPSLCYYSKVDGSYITHVGMDSTFKMFLKYGITDQLQTIPPNGRTACIGYNPIEQKWWGWSHRAIYGFGVGSTCKQGDCHYCPDNKENYIEDCIRFWSDECHFNMRYEEAVVDTLQGINIIWDYTDKVPNKELRGTTNSIFCAYPEFWGRGEWVAKDLADAKQMAIDFARGVS